MTEAASNKHRRAIRRHRISPGRHRATAAKKVCNFVTGFFSKEIWRQIGPLAPVFAVAAICITASIEIWTMTHAAEDRAIAQEFTSRATNQAVILQERINDYWDNFYAVRALFNTSTNGVTRGDFETFSGILLDRHPAIMNMAWIPRVTRAGRAAHELAAVRDGLPDYKIRALAPDGKLFVAPEQREYFPKFYSTEARTSNVYGLDLNDGGPRAQTLFRIRDENILSISPPLTLHIGEGDRRGFWAGLPVYAAGLPYESVEDRRRNLLGIIQGVFQIRVMFDAMLANVKSPVRIYLFTPNAQANDLPVYFKSRADVDSIEAKSQADIATGPHLAFPLKFGDVQWTLVVTPKPSGSVYFTHEKSWIVLLFGLLLSAVLTSLVWIMRRSAKNIEQQKLRFEAALNNMGQGLLMYDGVGKLIVFNRRISELFGVPLEKLKMVMGMTVPQTIAYVDDITKLTQNNQQIFAELQCLLEQRKHGTIIFERSDARTFAASPAPMADGGFVVTFEDITKRRHDEEKISHLAHYDALTNLPNRVLFYEKMQEFLTRRRRNGSIAVLSLDFDHFKNVNDTLGHPIGDKLLQEAAERMQTCVRDTDIVARMGGDEFGVVQSAIEQSSDASVLATRLIDAISAPYQIEGHQIIIGTSIGIAIAPGDGTKPDDLMKSADLALYRCKADGGNTYRFFELAMDAQMQERRGIEFDLRNALANAEFTLAYQPLVNLTTGKVSTCEALIRWHQPQRGLVPPLEFISIAEETGLIGEIGEWVLQRACIDATGWPSEVKVAVNVSPNQFKSGNFYDTVEQALKKSRLPPSRLELEITELVIMQESNAAIATLHRLKALGVTIAMDDFGSGYSSLGYLRSFPFDKIKIDQSFIRDLSKKKDGLAILRAVVGLGRGLGIVTTAEGVETEKQLEILRIEGCTEAQGYYFSKPRPAAEIKDLIASLDRHVEAVA